MLYVAAIAVLYAAALLYQQHVYSKRTSEREKEWALERGALLQRIQAPEIAVVEHAREDREPVPRVGYDNDAEFMAAKEALNGTAG